MDELDKLNWIKNDVDNIAKDCGYIQSNGCPYDDMDDMARINVFIEGGGRITGESDFIGGYVEGGKTMLLDAIFFLIEQYDLTDDILPMLKEEKRTFDSVISKAYKAINKK